MLKRGRMHILLNRWFRAFLFPLSLFYSAIIRLRNKFYDWRIFSSRKIKDCFVISVGNITVGGSGKTPAVEFLANHLAKRGKKVAVLSRGYRRDSQGTMLISDGHKISATVQESGDEPFLLASRLSGIPVVVESDRYKGCLYIQNKFHPEFIILDDAFQHRRIHRDLDIVLIDCTGKLESSRTLPAGLLREPLSGLKRADMVWLTRADQSTNIEAVVATTRRLTSVPIVRTIHYPQILNSLTGGKSIPLTAIRGKRTFIFSGIGNPMAFRDTLQKLGADITGELRFRDHHKYRTSDYEKIRRRAEEGRAEFIVCTEKDAVRLRSLSSHEIMVYSLRIQLKIIRGEDVLNDILKV